MGEPATLHQDVVAAEQKMLVAVRHIQDLDYDQADQVIDSLSDFGVSLLMGQILILQKMVEKRVLKIHAQP